MTVIKKYQKEILMLALVTAGVLSAGSVFAEEPKGKPVLWDRNESTVPLPNAEGKGSSEEPSSVRPLDGKEKDVTEDKISANSSESELKQEIQSLKERVSRIEKKLALEILDEQKGK